MAPIQMSPSILGWPSVGYDGAMIQGKETGGALVYTHFYFQQSASFTVDKCLLQGIY